MNGLASSLHKSKKGPWPPFPLSTRVHRIERFKKAKEEVGIFYSFRFKEVTFRRHDPQGKLKEYLQQDNFTWIYAHEDLLPGELSQHQLLLKSKILTPNQMIHIEKEAESQNSNIEKNNDAMERKILPRVEAREEDSSSSYMSMYNLDSGEENS